jgi:hypothetical protein
MCTVWIEETVEICLVYVCNNSTLFPCRAEECRTETEYMVDCVLFHCVDLPPPTPAIFELPFWVWVILGVTLTLLGGGIGTFLTWKCCRRPNNNRSRRDVASETTPIYVPLGGRNNSPFPRQTAAYPSSYPPSGTSTLRQTAAYPGPPSNTSTLSSRFDTVPLTSFSGGASYWDSAGATVGQGETKF